jgi:hypothetical protein
MRGGIGKITQVSPSWIYFTQSLQKIHKEIVLFLWDKILKIYVILETHLFIYIFGLSQLPLACWFESRRGRVYLSRVIVVRCQVEVSATGRSLFQRSPNECGVSECNIETSTMWRPRTVRAVESWEKKYIYLSPWIKRDKWPILKLHIYK